jgi:hypothetical protein
VGVFVGLPGVLGERSLEVEALANVHAIQVRRHGSIRVALDNEVQVSRGVWSQSAMVSALSDRVMHIPSSEMGV